MDRHSRSKSWKPEERFPTRHTVCRLQIQTLIIAQLGLVNLLRVDSSSSTDLTTSCTSIALESISAWAGSSAWTPCIGITYQPHTDQAIVGLMSGAFYLVDNVSSENPRIDYSENSTSRRLSQKIRNLFLKNEYKALQNAATQRWYMKTYGLHLALGGRGHLSLIYQYVGLFPTMGFP